MAIKTQLAKAQNVCPKEHIIGFTPQEEVCSVKRQFCGNLSLTPLFFFLFFFVLEFGRTFHLYRFLNLKCCTDLNHCWTSLWLEGFGCSFGVC